ncbi:hypothetical protein DAI22_03g329250 [Oryza sativa Japonica Group]|jgi:hypothetical protein|nr:hypothetical protein DAI22_03g329250 [Oryza sativa Japonica Group]
MATKRKARDDGDGDGEEGARRRRRRGGRAAIATERRARGDSDREEGTRGRRRRRGLEERDEARVFVRRLGSRDLSRSFLFL